MKKLVAIILTFLFVFVGCKKVEVKKIEVKKIEDNITVDAIRFKEEYEKVSEDNIYKYETYDNIIDVLKDGTGIIYFGFPSCKSCGDILPVLNDVAKENKIGEILYYNFKIIRRNNTKEYQDIIELLSDYLNEDDEGNKKLTAPTIVFVKNGEILNVYTANTVIENDVDTYFSRVIDEYMRYEPTTKEETTTENIESKNISE